jgi:hypothetical protein
MYRAAFMSVVESSGGAFRGRASPSSLCRRDEVIFSFVRRRVERGIAHMVSDDAYITSVMMQFEAVWVSETAVSPHTCQFRTCSVGCLWTLHWFGSCHLGGDRSWHSDPHRTRPSVARTSVCFFYGQGHCGDGALRYGISVGRFEWVKECLLVLLSFLLLAQRALGCPLLAETHSRNTFSPSYADCVACPGNAPPPPAATVSGGTAAAAAGPLAPGT